MSINLRALENNLHRLMWSGRKYTAKELYRLSGACRHWGFEYFRVKMRAYKPLYPCVDGIYSIKEPAKLNDPSQWLMIPVWIAFLAIGIDVGYEIFMGD